MNCTACITNFRMAALVLLILAGTGCGRSLAAESQDDAKVHASAASDDAPRPKSEFFRRPAAGVMQDVDPQRQPNETVARHDVVELLAVDPDLQWAKNVPFRTAVWNLQFKCKPVRMVWIDMPQKSGKMQRKAIYYMIYSVTNVPLAQQKSKPPKFGCIQPVEDKDGTYKISYEDRAVRFVPSFLMESPEVKKVYADRVIPIALAAIRRREDRLIPDWADKTAALRRPRLQTTVEIAGELEVGQTRWGVAMWEDIDPRVDRFSVYVRGLTNAYKWQDAPGRYKPGDPIGTGRRLARKTLKLNFWRPGDEFYEREDEIRRGIPGEPDYEWVYQ